MGSRRVLLAASGQALLFACGIAVVLALRSGYFASAAVCGGTALWIAASAAWRMGRPPPLLVGPPSPADGFEPERDRRMLRAYLDQAPAPLLSLEADGTLRVVNRAARRLFGVDDRVPEAPDLAAAVSDCVPGERRTLRLTAREGPPRAFALTTADVSSPDGSARLAALVDIEAEVQAAEAQVLRELLQVLSHELMNSLTPVASLAETAEDLLRDGDTGQALDAVQTLARRAAGLNRFVESYRSLARLPKPSPRDVSLSELVEDTARLFRTQWRAEGVALQLELSRNEVRAYLDPDLISQALLNLLANGAEAALAGPTRPAWVRLSASGGDHGVEILIADSGLGLGEADPGEIFKPFFTTKSNGSGVGLSLARQVVRSHGGDLAPEPPTPGAGAAFRLSIP